MQDQLQEELHKHLKAVRQALDSANCGNPDPYRVEPSNALYQKVVRSSVGVHLRASKTKGMFTSLLPAALVHCCWKDIGRNVLRTAHSGC